MNRSRQVVHVHDPEGLVFNPVALKTIGNLITQHDQKIKLKSVEKISWLKNKTWLPCVDICNECDFIKRIKFK